MLLLLSNQKVELDTMIDNIKSLDRRSKASLNSIGGYCIVEHLGQGAFGVVYKVNEIVVQ